MITAWGITDAGAVRQQNQDTCEWRLLSDDCAVGVVCDGMGGARAGNIASSLGIEAFLRAVDSHTAEQLREEPRGLLGEAVSAANQAVYSRAVSDADCKGMGTTLVSVLVADRLAYFLNIGDSRAYIISPDEIRQVTRDHSVVGDLLARGELTPQQAKEHPQKNLITRVLGAEEQVRADLYEEPVQAGQFILLCSDGLSNMVSDQEILYEILYGGAPSDCCRRLLEIALTRGAPDNVTALLLQL